MTETKLDRATRLPARLALAAVLLAAGISSAQAQTALPPLPEAIKSAGVLKVGVRCDQPPYGFKDETGKFAGVETEMALQLGTWAFGSPDKVELTCVTAENRIHSTMARLGSCRSSAPGIIFRMLSTGDWRGSFRRHR